MLYSGYSAAFGDSVGGDLTFTQMLGMEIGANLRIEEYVVPGTIDRAVNLVMTGEPKIPLRTHDGLFFLQNVPITTGFRCDEGATFRLQKRAQDLDADGAGTLGAFMSTEAHAKVTSTGGFLCPLSISVSQGQLATFAMEYYAWWTGDRSVLPLVAAFSQALANAPSFNSAYTLGPVKLTGGSPAIIPGVVGWEFQTGLQIVPHWSEGLAFPDFCTLQMRKPRIVLRFETPEPVAQIGNMFKAALGNTITMYLRRKSNTEGHGNVADATTSHASIAVATGSWLPEQVSVNEHDSASLTIPILPTGVVTKSYATAIPTS